MPIFLEVLKIAYLKQKIVNNFQNFMNFWKFN